MANRNTKEVAVCPYCGEPLLWTFIYSGAEWYCLRCGYSCGMFGEKRAEATPELKMRRVLYKRVFNTIAKDIIPAGAYYDKCDKCKPGGAWHVAHASNREKVKDKEARRLLTILAGYGNEKDEEED